MLARSVRSRCRVLRVGDGHPVDHQEGAMFVRLESQQPCRRQALELCVVDDEEFDLHIVVQPGPVDPCGSSHHLVPHHLIGEVGPDQPWHLVHRRREHGRHPPP
jgi:hypothetical protein